MSMAVATRRAPYPVRANHKRCAKCGKLVSRAAFACRRCGKRQRVRPRTILLIFSGCLIGGMFAAASASVGLVPGRTPEPLAVQVPVPGPSAVGHLRLPAPAVSPETPVVSAADLWMAYARDGVVADRRFKDRTVVVSGTVRSVDRDFDGSAVVRLTTGDPFETVNARLASRNDPAIASLAKGKSAELVCVGRGALIGAPSLGNCFVR